MKTLLFLHFRNFGDAVIGLGLIEGVRLAQPEIQIDVLSRPEYSFLFRNQPAVRNLYTADFPIGTVKRFTLRSSFHLIAELFRARSRRYDAVANLFGDVRENLAGWLIARRGNYGIIWPKTHPVSIQSRIGPAFLLSHPVFVSNPREGIYAAMNLLGAALGATASTSPQLFDGQRRAIRNRPVARRIGLHVSAGQECKRWPMRDWVILASSLLDEGSEVRIYCAANERETVQPDFEALLVQGKPITIVAGTLNDLLKDIASCSSFVGHDSFGIHAASAIGVPCVLINGPNIAQVWAPPGTAIVHGDEELPCYPCYGKPTCTEGPQPYACIRSIEVDDVKKLIQLPIPVHSASIAG